MLPIVLEHLNTHTVILYGKAYDVTAFLASHPGGANAILALAGQDATDEYDPVHPPGTLETLPAEACLGQVDATSSPAMKGSSNRQTGSRTESQHTTSQTASNTAHRAAHRAATRVEADPEELLNLEEFAAAAQAKLSERAWAYYSSASDDMLSKQYNSLSFRTVLLRPRVFVDVTACNLGTGLLRPRPSLWPQRLFSSAKKEKLAIKVPFYVAPAAMARLAHPDGERGIAKAAARFGAAMIISNNASMTPEQIVNGAPEDQVFGWQLYVQNDRRKSEQMLQRIARLKQIKFVVLTLDAPVPGKREADERVKQPVPSQRAEAPEHDQHKTADETTPRASGRDSQAQTTDAPPKSAGLGRALFAGTAADLAWQPTLAWLLQHCSLPVVLKGIQTHEDALLACSYAPQVAGIVLSNHGGRAADTAPPALLTLLEIRRHCPHVMARLDVWLDGGIKRGTDVVKALALGAKAVGLGRAPLYGLAVAGQRGVERTLEILKAETETAMRLLGVADVAALSAQHVNTKMLDRLVCDGRDSGGLMRSFRARL